MTYLACISGLEETGTSVEDCRRWVISKGDRAKVRYTWCIPIGASAMLPVVSVRPPSGIDYRTVDWIGSGDSGRLKQQQQQQQLAV